MIEHHERQEDHMACSKKRETYRNPFEVVSPIDLITRSAEAPFYLMFEKEEVAAAEAHQFMEFYATKWTGERVWEDRGHGHGSRKRAWTFHGFARKAIGGSLEKPTWSKWIRVRGRFIEGASGIAIVL